MRFSYICGDGHRSDENFPPGKAAEHLSCMTPISGKQRFCFRKAHRDYATDFASHTISTGDPFRAYHLSSAKARAAADQGRPIGGPTDNFDRRRDEAVRGITYVGNDTSGMSAAARRGIERARATK